MAIRKDIRDTVGNDGRSGVAEDLDLRSTGDGVGPATPEENLLLAKLPPEELKAFTAKAERVTLKTRDVLFENGDAITAVYFPVSAMISLLTVLSGGPSIEAIPVGYEGAAGLPLFHGVKTSYLKAVCQIGGDAYRISVEDFESVV